MVQQPQGEENAAPPEAAPESSSGQATVEDNGAPAVGTRGSSQAGTPQRQAAPRRAPKSSDLTNKDAAEAWAQALKARIEQRRKRAAQKQDANKQNDGG
jgi:hypothetical protein